MSIMDSRALRVVNSFTNHTEKKQNLFQHLIGYPYEASSSHTSIFFFPVRQTGNISCFLRILK